MSNLFTRSLKTTNVQPTGHLMSILIICSLFICSAWTANVQWFFQDFAANVEDLRELRIYPLRTGPSGTGKLITADWLVVKTDSSGSCIVSNILDGTNWTYRAEFIGKYTATTNWLTFPVTNGLINAHDCVTK